MPAITIAHFGIHARLGEVGCECCAHTEFGEGNDEGKGEYHSSSMLGHAACCRPPRQSLNAPCNPHRAWFNWLIFT